MPESEILEHVKKTLQTQLIGIRNGGQAAYALTFYDGNQDLTIAARDAGFIHIFEAYDDEFYRATRNGYFHVRHLLNAEDQKVLDMLFDDSR